MKMQVVRRRTRGKAKYHRLQNTINVDLRRILTCRLKLWDNIAEIFQYIRVIEIGERFQRDLQKSARLFIKAH